MGRVIRGQVIAGTGLDLHGERLSRDELEALYTSWTEEIPAGVEHDPSQRPACRIFNKRLEPQPNGELVLIADVEILDEAAFSQFGGFSIGFSRRRIRVGEGNANTEVALNPRQFDFDEVVAAVAAADLGESSIDLVERIEKADLLVVAIMVIVIHAVSDTFSGFFNAAGGDLYELLSHHKRKDNPEGPKSIHYHVHLAPERRIPVVVLVVDPSCTPADIRAVDGPALVALVEARFGHLPIQKVAGRLLPGGNLAIDHVTGLDGRILFEAEDS